MVFLSKTLAPLWQYFLRHRGHEVLSHRAEWMIVFALNPAEARLMLLTPQEEKCDAVHTV